MAARSPCAEIKPLGGPVIKWAGTLFASRPHLFLRNPDMELWPVALSALILLATLAPAPAEAANDKKSAAYPPARRDDTIVDEYHGTKVTDPYRWLENPDAPESRPGSRRKTN
jgi:hypothetical protein